jgi:hypothetical protein
MEQPSSGPAVRYLEQLSDTDLGVLGSASGVTGDRPIDEAAGFLRRRPELIEPALGRPATFEWLFGQAPERALSLVDDQAFGEDRSIEHRAEVSPFLLFAVAVHRGVHDLEHTPYVAERFGGHKRIPVFDTATLRDYYLDPSHRLFAVEHLASYIRVQSGPVWVRRGDRWRRQRFSELEPQRLAGLLDVVAEEEKPGIYRRLGDLALFLTGIFPDHSARTLHPIETERLVRSVAGMGGPPVSLDDIGPAVLSGRRDGLLRLLGPRWYRIAADLTPLPPVRALLADAAEGFDVARRFLNMLTDRYLFPLRDGWFGSAAS